MSDTGVATTTSISVPRRKKSPGATPSLDFDAVFAAAARLPLARLPLNRSVAPAAATALSAGLENFAGGPDARSPRPVLCRPGAQLSGDEGVSAGLTAWQTTGVGRLGA